MRVYITYEIILRGHEMDVEVTGECTRNILGEVECNVVHILGNMIQDFDPKHLEHMRVRLVNQYLSGSTNN